jgi:hypothetical protein
MASPAVVRGVIDRPHKSESGSGAFRIAVEEVAGYGELPYFVGLLRRASSEWG